MSRSNTQSLSIRLLMIVFTVVLFGADMTVSAQNANSSTTPDESMQNTNMTTTTNTNRGRRRRGRRRRGGNMNTAANTTAAMTPVSTGRCDPMQQEQTDLSGTYTGTVDYPEGGLSGESTLTITGNDFSMTSGSSTQEGRVVAVTTCNYTAVTMRFGKDAPAAPGTTPPPPLPTVSLRARRTGNGVMLSSVGGETRQFSFSSGGGGGRRGRRQAATPAPMTHVR